MVQSEGTSIQALETIDYNHVLYLHPSDAPGTILVAHQLTGVENYSVWNRSMRIALLAKNKLGFVDGTCKKDAFPTSMQDQWERCNALVLSWLINTVTKTLSAGIVFASNAAAVWRDLKERFDKVDGSRVYHLHREISSLVQGTYSVSEYFSRMRLLWDEYDSLVPVSYCGCPGSTKVEQHITQQRLFQFLMGLSEVYAGARSQILLMKPLPSVNQAYNMISEDESQRQISVGVQERQEPIAMYSSVQGGTGANSQKRFMGVCDHCKVKGHKKIDCFKLYPEKRKRFTSQANNVVMEDGGNVEQSVVSQQVPPLTKDQYDQLIGLLNKAPTSAMVNMASTMANMAGTSATGSLQWQDSGDW